MSADPTRNVVVFQLGDGDTGVAEAPTVADDCVRRAWDIVCHERAFDARDVTALYSEWEPSAADRRFLAETFPSAQFSYSFPRPDADGWPEAFEAARRAMDDAMRQRDSDRTTTEGELLPILWSPSEMLDFLPHLTLVPDRLHLAVAWVTPTPHGTIGKSHVTHQELAYDMTLRDLLDIAFDNLRVDLHIDAEQSPVGTLLTLRRTGSIAAAAVALPDFHERMSEIVGDARLVVGLPCQEHLLVTGAASTHYVQHIQEILASSPHENGDLAPTMALVEATGLTLIT